MTNPMQNKDMEAFWSQYEADYGAWKTESDEYILDVWKYGTPLEQEIAAAILYMTYSPKLYAAAYHTYPYQRQFAEDVVQDIWNNFFPFARVNEVQNVRALLWSMYRTQRAVALDKWWGDLAVQLDEARDVSLSVTAREAVDNAEDYVLGQVTKEEAQFVNQALDERLAPSEKVIWNMVARLRFSPAVTARLLGKQRGTIDTTIYNAIERLEQYSKTPAFEVDFANWKLNRATYQRELSNNPFGLDWWVLAEAPFVIDWFSKRITPGLTPDELAPLGISGREMNHNYYVSLVQASEGGAKAQVVGDWNPMVMLLTRIPSWQSLNRALKRVLRHRKTLPAKELTAEELNEDILPFGSAFTVQINMLEDSIILNNAGFLQFGAPSWDSPLHPESPPDYLRLHSPRVVISGDSCSYSMWADVERDGSVPYDMAVFREWHKDPEGVTADFLKSISLA